MGLISGLKKIFYIVKEKVMRAFVKVKNALTVFFEKAVNLMKTVINKIATRVPGIILGAAHFYRKVGEIYQEGTRNYSLEEEIGEWNETIVTKEIEVNEIPPKYRILTDGEEIDNTQEIDASLTY